MEMKTAQGPGGRGCSDQWPSAVLLEEANHRVANEVAAALAAMRLSLGRGGRPPSRPLLERAIERLEGFGECVRLLGGPMEKTVDVGIELERLCRAMLQARPNEARIRLTLEIGRWEVDRVIARTLLQVAHELVTNALKHALHEGGSLRVRLERLASDLVLSVIDDGPGLGSSASSLTSGTRLGGRIVGELVGATGGWIDCDTGPQGTAIHVMMPMARKRKRRSADV